VARITACQGCQGALSGCHSSLQEARRVERLQANSEEGEAMSTEPNPFKDIPVYIDLRGTIVYKRRYRNSIGDKDEKAYIKEWLSHGILLDDKTFIVFALINYITPKEAVQ
jgi:hypothetical protein